MFVFCARTCDFVGNRRPAIPISISYSPSNGQPGSGTSCINASASWATLSHGTFVPRSGYTLTRVHPGTPEYNLYRYICTVEPGVPANPLQTDNSARKWNNSVRTGWNSKKSYGKGLRVLTTPESKGPTSERTEKGGAARLLGCRTGITCQEKLYLEVTGALSWRCNDSFADLKLIGVGVGSRPKGIDRIMSRPRYLVPFLVAVHACTFLLLGVHGLKRQEWSNPDRLVLGLPSERKATGVGVDGILFIVGGTNTASGKIDAFRYDPEEDEWADLSGQMVGHVPPAVSRHQIVAFEDGLYLFGGVDFSGNFLSGLFLLNTTTLTWFDLGDASGDAPGPRTDPAIVAATMAGHAVIFLHGGKDES
eukprot:2985372-Rhodomonas_salina.1